MIHILRLIVGLAIIYFGGCGLVTFYAIMNCEVEELPRFIRISGGVTIVIFTVVLLLFVSYIIGYIIMK